VPARATASEAGAVLTPGAIYRRLLSICSPFWKIFLLAGLAMAVYAVTDTGFAFLMQNMVEVLDPDGLTPEQAVIRRWMPLAILALFMVRGAVAFLSAYWLGWIGRHVIKVLRGQAFAKFLVLPTRFFDATSGGELVTVLVRDTLTVICLLAYMVYLSPMLTLILAVTGPLMAFVIRFLSTLFRRHSTRIQESMGDVTKITGEALQSHRIVKIFGGQDYETGRFEDVNEKNRRLNLRLIASRAGGDALTNMVIAIGVGGVMYFVLHESIRPVEEADLVGFITAMVFLLRPIRQLTNVNVSIQRGIAAGSSIFQLLDESAERDTGHYEVTRVTGKVEFRNVNFAYTDRKGPVLNDIDLSVPPGQTLAIVGIVGRSGSGKSTLVSLLPRFYEPESGQILIDDRPLNDYRLVSLRNQISLVSQEVVLFNDSIASNIAYGGLPGNCPTGSIRRSEIVVYCCPVGSDRESLLHAHC
jgi:subfamily B ATP-binding cassette protein MsbA